MVGADGQRGEKGRPVAELSYTEASGELDEIVAFFEGREVDVDQLVGRLERATAIVDELDRRLRRTRAQVEELVPRLAATAGQADDAGEDFDEIEEEELDEADLVVDELDEVLGAGDPGAAPGLF
jgi:exodeoxyribonuclease VII small subunit